jgi:hypothetical protein
MEELRICDGRTLEDNARTLRTGRDVGYERREGGFV